VSRGRGATLWHSAPPFAPELGSVRPFTFRCSAMPSRPTSVPPRWLIYAINAVCFAFGVLFVIAGSWVLDQLLADGIVKTLAEWVLFGIALTLFSGISYTAGQSQRAVHPGIVRGPFRVLAWVLGPLLILSGCFMLFACFAFEQGSGVQEIAGFGATAVGSIVAGVLFLRAARTGRDPFIRGSGPR